MKGKYPTDLELIEELVKQARKAWAMKEYRTYQADMRLIKITANGCEARAKKKMEDEA